MVESDPIHVQCAQRLVSTTKRWISAEWRLRGISITLVTVYPWSGEGMSNRNWEIFVQLRHFLKASGIPFLIMADFNMTPQQLEDSGWLESLDAMCLVPEVLTTAKRSKRIIDFGVCSKSIRPMLTIPYEVPGTPWSPHLAFVIWVYSRPRSLLSRVQSVPKPLPWLEFKPLWETLSNGQQSDAYDDAHLQATAKLIDAAKTHRTSYSWRTASCYFAR